MAETSLAGKARQNGSGDAEVDLEQGRDGRPAGGLGGLLGDALGAVRKRASKRLRADLHDRDPDYLREMLPLLWLISTFYFRGSVRNLGNIPEDEPALLVGNHSGGNVIPDNFIFTLAFSPGELDEYTYPGLPNPLGIGGAVGDVLSAVESTGDDILPIVVLLSISSTIFRFTRSRKLSFIRHIP